MSTDSNQGVEQLLHLACGAVGAEWAELVLDESAGHRLCVSLIDEASPINAPAGFFDSPRSGVAEDFAELDNPDFAAIVCAPITGPSAEAGWVVAVHRDPAGLVPDAATFLDTVVELIEMQLDREVEHVRLDQLSEALREQQDALHVVQARLELSNTELEQFAYIAAHELLSPLRSVVVYTELLQSHLTTLDSSQIEACANEIRRGVSVMDEQLHHLLKLSSTQQEAVDPVLVDLDAIVQECLTGAQPMLDEAQATVRVEALPKAMGRAVLLQSVFSNLVTNAIKYQEPGVPPSIRIFASESGSENHIHVEDNGPGIAPGDQQRVFGLFERASTESSGSGIGLGLSRRIVEAFGGSIRYETADSGGSIFTLSFPKVTEAE